VRDATNPCVKVRGRTTSAIQAVSYVNGHPAENWVDEAFQ
jgi:hypothetical protein